MLVLNVEKVLSVLASKHTGLLARSVHPAASDLDLHCVSDICPINLGRATVQNPGCNKVSITLQIFQYDLKEMLLLFCLKKQDDRPYA